MMAIESATPMSPHTVGTAYLNGAKVRVTFDTGAGSSIVGLRAAAKAGIKPDGPGVESAGNGSGIGRHEIQTWVANFPVLKIGDEEVYNARLRFGDLGDLDMLLGADFFLSHRIFVASSQGRVYFTYNGGPVFNLNGTRKTAQAQGAGPQPGESQPASDQTALAGETDATVVARRAAASAARRDFEPSCPVPEPAAQRHPAPLPGRDLEDRAGLFRSRSPLKSIGIGLSPNTPSTSTCGMRSKVSSDLNSYSAICLAKKSLISAKTSLDSGALSSTR